MFQHHSIGHDCQTRISHETPCQRPVPHSRAVHCPFCTRVCSSGDLLLELVLTKHRDLCRGAKTSGDDDSSDKAGTMVAVGGESLSLSRSSSMTDAADIGSADWMTGGATVMSMSDSLGNLTSILGGGTDTPGGSNQAKSAYELTRYE